MGVSIPPPSPSPCHACREESPYSLGHSYSLEIAMGGSTPLSSPSPCHACREEPPNSLGPSYSLGESRGREHASPSSFALPRLQGGAALQPGTIRQSARELACRATAWEGPGAALD